MSSIRSKRLPLSLSPKAVLSQLICVTPLTCALLPRLITVTSSPYATKYSAAYLLTNVVPPVIRIFISCSFQCKTVFLSKQFYHETGHMAIESLYCSQKETDLSISRKVWKITNVNDYLFEKLSER